jgi:hypothetical protein
MLSAGKEVYRILWPLLLVVALTLAQISMAGGVE